MSPISASSLSTSVPVGVREQSAPPVERGRSLPGRRGRVLDRVDQFPTELREHAMQFGTEAEDGQVVRPLVREASKMDCPTLRVRPRSFAGVQRYKRCRLPSLSIPANGVPGRDAVPRRSVTTPAAGRLAVESTVQIPSRSSPSHHRGSPRPVSLRCLRTRLHVSSAPSWSAAQIDLDGV